MRCVRCDCDNRAEAKFCRACAFPLSRQSEIDPGATLPEAETETPDATAILVLPELPTDTTATRLKSIGMTLIAAGVLVSAAIGLYFVQNSEDSDQGNAATAILPTVPPAAEPAPEPQPEPAVDSVSASPPPTQLASETTAPVRLAPRPSSSSSSRPLKKKGAERKSPGTKESEEAQRDAPPQQSDVAPEIATRIDQAATDTVQLAPPLPKQPEKRDPAPKPIETNIDWRASLRTDLDTCQRKNLFERILCTEKTRWKYCDPNRWNTVSECVLAKSESPNR